MKALLATLLCLMTVLSVFSQSTEVFLRERVSTTTKTGVVGYPPGTKAEVVSKEGNKLKIKIENQLFEVSPNQITNDVEAAHQLAAQDAAHQSAVQQQLSAAAMASAKPKQVQQSAALPATVDAQANDRLAQIHKEREELKIELDQIKFEQKGLPKPNSKKYAWGHLKRFGSSPNAEKLANERKELEQKIFDLDQEERRLKLEAK